MADEKPEGAVLIVHSMWPRERKLVGEIAGIPVYADPKMPDDEIRLVHNGRVIERLKLS